jgi:hypothetical protein
MQITITGRQLDFGDASRAHIENGPEGPLGGQPVMLRDPSFACGRDNRGLVRTGQYPERTS